MLKLRCKLRYFQPYTLKFNFNRSITLKIRKSKIEFFENSIWVKCTELRTFYDDHSYEYTI